eukprot:g37251.t1
MLETLGRILQAGWSVLFDCLQGGQFNVTVWGGWLCLMLTYWLYGGLLLCVDVWHRPQLVQRLRFQPQRPFALNATPYNPSLAALLRNVLFNQVFVILPGIFLLDCLTPLLPLPWRTGVLVTRELPALTDWILRATAQHHLYRAPHALAALFAHPLESLLGNTFAVMGPAFFCGFHISQWLLAVVAGVVSTCSAHSGYALPWAPRVQGHLDFHDYHHSNFVGNYGTFGFIDALHGTDEPWKSSRCSIHVTQKQSLASTSNGERTKHV